ncbi:hypothetical protein ABVT39_022964 [Epinephelus coioides]
MGDWSYMSALLDKVQSHSTVVGKIWMSVLFLFRIFVLGAAADKVWGDEVSEFYCDTLEPGCHHACYNWMFPISYVHYWVLQITFVSTPTLVYLGHAVHIIHKEKRMMEQLRDCTNGTVQKKPKYTDDRGKVKITGVSVLLNIIEIIYLLCNKRRERRKQLEAHQHMLSPQQRPSNPGWGDISSQYGGVQLLPLSGQGLTSLCNDDKHIDSISKEKDT